MNHLPEGRKAIPLMPVLKLVATLIAGIAAGAQGHRLAAQPVTLPCPVCQVCPVSELEPVTVPEAAPVALPVDEVSK